MTPIPGSREWFQEQLAARDRVMIRKYRDAVLADDSTTDPTTVRLFLDSLTKEEVGRLSAEILPRDENGMIRAGENGALVDPVTVYIENMEETLLTMVNSFIHN